jgi:hypothetical protein
VVVYDPSAGFITGGGWFDSPAGAYTPDPALVGPALFGFVSKYKKGKATPDGSTRFEFRTAGFTFSSTHYDWLVLAGAKAMYKGEGTVGGAGSYGFLLTAIDGDFKGDDEFEADLFRIKIWDPSNEDVVVYDNALGASDDASAGSVLGGGSVVLHTGKGKGKAGKGGLLESESEEVPSEIALEAAYPNPFNPTTTIGFALPEASEVRLVVYDVLGREVARLVDGRVEAGRHRMRFEAGSLPSGTYLYRLEAGSFVAVGQVLLVK